MIISVNTTSETAQAVLWALREHMNQRRPVREYVDQRYKYQDEAFRNRKIGEIQERLDRLQLFSDRLLTAVALQPHGESK